MRVKNSWDCDKPVDLVLHNFQKMVHFEISYTHSQMPLLGHLRYFGMAWFIFCYNGKCSKFSNTSLSVLK